MNRIHRMPPATAWNRRALALFLVLWAVSCIRVPYPKYFWLQHVPTVAVVLALAAADRRWPISRLSYTLILAFMTLHLLGARYLYSYVPYDVWSERFGGFRITDRCGFTRNHYDRFVHFCFGLLLVVPAWQFARRVMGLSAAGSVAAAISLILSTSALYEIFEWLVAVVMAPDWADSFNGQQGDPWDAQWDMALAMVGSIVGLALAAPVWLRHAARDRVKLRSP
jgi:putative membrane protein